MLNLVVLASSPRGPAARLTEYLARRDGADWVVRGVLLDEGKREGRRKPSARFHSWLRRGGLAYAFWRSAHALRCYLAASPQPGSYPRSLETIGAMYGFPVLRVGSLNSSEAQELLRSLRPDLALAVGVRPLREETFRLPRLGTLNLHYGKIPQYRGIPPCFWELYEGSPTLGITVHWMSRQIDCGEVVARTELAILPTDDTVSLFQRALQVDGPLVVQALERISRGEAPLALPVKPGMPLRTLPAPWQVWKLSRRLGRPIDPLGYQRAAIPELDPAPEKEPVREKLHLH